MTAQLIRQLREQRMRWIELPEGKRVRIIRPTEVEMVRTLLKGGMLSVDVEEVKRFVVDWDGFTEATLLGAGVGGPDPVPFTSELWAEVIGDRTEWVRTVAEAILDLVVAHKAAAVDDAKN